MAINDYGIREARASARVAVAATVVLTLTSGCTFYQPKADRAAPRSTAAAAAPPDAPATLPWVSAMVARNGTDITVYSGPGDARCKELWQPRATITEQDAGRVVIAVQARIVDATDCAASGRAVPVAAPPQPQPHDGRPIRDAATGSTPPIYFERDLPDLGSDKRWSPFSSHWMSTEQSWHQGYNGPGGSVLLLSAQPTAGVVLPAAVTTSPIGSRQGTITGAAGKSWTVWWEVGEVTYSLRLEPPEGGTFTLKQFKQEIARLRWP
ncbi:hypothetical protein ABZ671_20685 [Micromonospora sp. NPDC006766]|uniref:hypothetical protein n=1 Tax=Micromonospora sp. NPDC006766 TaxID=3154778 RepID=UPI0033EC3F26